MSYDKETNPFYSSQDDDFGFGKSKGSQGDFGGRNTDPFAFNNDGGGSAMSKYERIQQLKENSMNRQLESTQRAMASLYDSEAVGIATAEELVQQGEQLDNVETKLDKINQDMKTSQRHLNSIKSVFGGIKNWWKGGKETDESTTPQKPKSTTAPGLQSAMENSSRATESSGPHPAFRLRSEDGSGFYEDEDLDSKFLGAGSRRYDQPAARQQQQAARAQANSRPAQPQFKSGLTSHDERFEANLDMMSEGMERLKGLAKGMGSEIERQNEQLERIQPKADRADIKLTDQNRQMRKILR